MTLRTLLFCLLLAGCGSGGDEPVAVVCEKNDLICETQQYAPTKQHYGEQR